MLLVPTTFLQRRGGGTLTTGRLGSWPLTADGTASFGPNDLGAAGSPAFGTVGGQACVTVSPGNHMHNASPTGLGLNTVTVAAWIYPTGTTSSMAIVGEFAAQSGANLRWILRANGTRLNFTVSDGATTVPAETGTSFLTGSAWQLVWGEYDPVSGDVNCYLNAAATPDATANAGYATLAGSFGLGVGGDGDGGGSNAEFEGSIKGVVVWNALKSAAHRSEYYNGGTPNPL